MIVNSLKIAKIKLKHVTIIAVFTMNCCVWWIIIATFVYNSYSSYMQPLPSLKTRQVYGLSMLSASAAISMEVIASNRFLYN
jgi:hypothetical protein